MSFVVSALFRSGFQVFDKTQIGFLDLLFDAVWFFFPVSRRKNLLLNDFNGVHVFSSFANDF